MEKKLKFNTTVNYQPKKYPSLGGKTQTEQTGYVPPKVRISEMIMAGKRLAEARKEQFDRYLDGGNTTPDVPITRKRGVDMSEVISEGQRLAEKKLASDKAKFEASQKAKDQQIRDEIRKEIQSEIEQTIKNANNPA